MQSALATRNLYEYVNIESLQQRVLHFTRSSLSYHSLLAAEDSFLDKDQTAILAEVEASDGEVDLAAAAAAADLARGELDQGYLAPEDLP